MENFKYLVITSKDDYDSIYNGNNSYYDLDDGGISLNDYGGLNYHEVYANFVLGENENQKVPGIINFKDSANNEGTNV